MSEFIKIDRVDSSIRIPGNLLLNADGIRIFSNGGRPLERLNNIDQALEEGMKAKVFNAQTVQKLVVNGYLSEIYTCLPELLRYRNPIIDTTKLIVYGILYKKLNPVLAKQLIHSPVLQQYNRKNPNSAIRELKNVPISVIEKLITSQKQILDSIELELNQKVVEKIRTNSSLSEEDKALQLRSVDKFISFIDKRIWYLYLIIYRTPLKENMLNFFIDLIVDYIDRTKMATHLAMILMELIQNAEKAHFESIMYSEHIIPVSESSFKFLRKPANRNLVTNHAERKRQYLHLSWRFFFSSVGTNVENKIEIIIKNQGSMSYATEQKLAAKMNQDMGDSNLSHFFEEKEEKELGAGLGLLYLSYLKEECQKAGMRFNSQIYTDKNDNRITAKLIIIF